MQYHWQVQCITQCTRLAIYGFSAGKKPEGTTHVQGGNAQIDAWPLLQDNCTNQDSIQHKDSINTFTQRKNACSFLYGSERCRCLTCITALVQEAEVNNTSPEGAPLHFFTAATRAASSSICTCEPMLEASCRHGTHEHMTASASSCPRP